MLNILQSQMYALQKCIFASNAFLHQMHFCITFSFGKCDAKMHFCTAEHFPLENVRQNAFWHQMHFCIKCIFASNAFVTFCVTKCTHQMHFCTAEHFPLENVRQNAFLHQQNVMLNIFQRKM